MEHRRGFAGVAAVVLAMAVFTAGCGSGSPVGLTPPTEPETRTAVMREVFDIIESVGMAFWADYGRDFLNDGRILPIDFSSPELNPFGISGWDGAADLSNGLIYVDQTVWLTMPPRHLAIVMLDELAHHHYQTGDHTDYERLQAEFVQRWSEYYGRGFNELGPEDEAYREWWEGFFRVHPNG